MTVSRIVRRTQRRARSSVKWLRVVPPTVRRRSSLISRISYAQTQAIAIPTPTPTDPTDPNSTPTRTHPTTRPPDSDDCAKDCVKDPTTCKVFREMAITSNCLEKSLAYYEDQLCGASGNGDSDSDDSHVDCEKVPTTCEEFREMAADCASQWPVEVLAFGEDQLCGASGNSDFDFDDCYVDCEKVPTTCEEFREMAADCASGCPEELLAFGEDQLCGASGNSDFDFDDCYVDCEK
ncbi:hypothetical protein CYMTET_35965, partial [Cymbomonas tetramitiformis]